MGTLTKMSCLPPVVPELSRNPDKTNYTLFYKWIPEEKDPKTEKIGAHLFQW